jgi:hypothetical protein
VTVRDQGVYWYCTEPYDEWQAVTPLARIVSYHIDAP